jgi:hypothetical protein
MTRPTTNNGTPHRLPGDNLADALRRVLAIQAARQGKPPPPAEQCDAFLGLLLGRPFEDVPTPRRRKRTRRQK